MNIIVNVSLNKDDTLPTLSPEEIITAFGGDPATDACSLSVSSSYAPEPPVPLGITPPKSEPK